MRWDDVLLAVTDAAASNAVLSGIFGSNIRQKGTIKHQIPSLESWLVSDTETEVFEPTVIQWDQWTASLSDLIASERALRKLFDPELQVTIGGVALFCEFIDGADLDVPSRDNVYARAVRFTFEPIREALQRP